MRLLLLTALLLCSLFSMGMPKDYYNIKDTKQMKKYFFNYIKEISNKQNDLILEERKYVTEHYNNPDTKFNKIKKRYKIKDKAPLKTYLKHIDIVPTSIVLAQASVESGWGKSRFVKQANNIFGQWTWTGKGLVPKNRDAGKKHKIRIFNSMEQSVRGYLINLNLGHAYKDFRTTRANLRQNNQQLKGRKLTSTLINYSQLREKYVKILDNMIRREKLERFD